MFSPATRKSNHSAFKGQNVGSKFSDSSNFTPIGDNRRSSHIGDSIPNRPKTGTPAPWTSRLSVFARIPPVKKDENGKDSIEPVYIGEFPQVVRDEQTKLLQKRVPGQASIAGGMDKGTALSWIISGSKLFIWSYLSPSTSSKCIALDLPSDVLQVNDMNRNSYPGNSWLMCVVNWENDRRRDNNMLQHLNSAGVVLCNLKTRAVIYWPDIYSGSGAPPVMSCSSTDELVVKFSPQHWRSPRSSQQLNHKNESILTISSSFNSLIASAISVGHRTCVALASSSNGELWLFSCSPTGIQREKVFDGILSSDYPTNDSIQPTDNYGYPRSLTWRFPSSSLEDSNEQFFLLTDHEIQCFDLQVAPNLHVSKLWSQEIIGTDNDLGVKKDLAGQKKIWPLDVQVDEHGKEITILVAIFCKDRVSSSSYTQYSLLTMQYKSGFDESSESLGLKHDRALEKKAPVQVIIPKARVEDEESLFSMRIRVGGKPLGSVVILSGDATATVSYYWRSSTRLYQFDLPYDAGKVLDASVFPSTDDGEEGAWVVLTEKAGVWAIPEKAVLLGGVEPPERSLSRKGSTNEGSVEETGKTLSKMGNFNASSKAFDSGDKSRAGFPGIVRRTARDEEAEALLSHLFHEFLLSGQVDVSLEKLKNCGAFEKDGETNAFVRMSKSIVDTLAKHWTTTRGAEIVSLAVVSNQLMEKQQKHQKFLQFLALSKCHEELCVKQRYALQIIMEHGEKLAGMIELRELQNMIRETRSTRRISGHSHLEKEATGSLWDLIQIVGERARRNTVLLMDRDNSEVFYSKVSDTEEVFYCLDKQLNYIISNDQPLKVQVERACELSTACVTFVRSAMRYKNEYHVWYPPPDGLTPWYSQHVVRDGLWAISSFVIRLLNESYGIELSDKSDLCSRLELLTDIVLETYVGAITAKTERGEEYRDLSEEYWNRRDALLDSLYQQVKVFVEAQCQNSLGETEEQKQEILRKLSSNLLAIARRHEGYRILWNISCDLDDSALLRDLMRESVGPKAGFSYFVFEQLYKKKQFSKLLRLGEEFPQELVTFLKDREDLLWLHEIFLHRFSDASKTLHGLALSEFGMLTETVPGFGEEELKLSDRKRLLYLSRIAAAAGREADCETEMNRINADIKILKSQEEICKLISDDEEKQNIGKRLLSPVDLIRLCLKTQDPELLLRAFDVFAWTSSSFRRCNQSLLEECWRNAADQDEWEKLYQFSITEGWTDEDPLRVLKKTMLFKASRLCYGPESECFEGGFDEVLPLRQKDVKGSSVESILMQHKDFSDAGKLMITATMLGSARVDIGVEDNGLLPME